MGNLGSIVSGGFVSTVIIIVILTGLAKLVPKFLGKVIGPLVSVVHTEIQRKRDLKAVADMFQFEINIVRRIIASDGYIKKIQRIQDALLQENSDVVWPRARILWNNEDLGSIIDSVLPIYRNSIFRAGELDERVRNEILESYAAILNWLADELSASEYIAADFVEIEEKKRFVSLHLEEYEKIISPN